MKMSSEKKSHVTYLQSNGMTVGKKSTEEAKDAPRHNCGDIESELNHVLHLYCLWLERKWY